MIRNERHGRNRVRLLAMYHLQLGKSLKAVSAIIEVHWKTVQSWLRRFRDKGFEGLFESHRSGANKKLNSLQEAFITDTINKLSNSKTGGYITGKELHSMLIQNHNAKCSLRTIYNTRFCRICKKSQKMRRQLTNNSCYLTAGSPFS